jgi:5-methyltetrahydropteroyltriglutamate--homocysteine methyltransferase
MITSRADVVGSLLRPPWLLKAQQDFASDTLSPSSFNAIEDRAVVEAVALHA